MTGNIVPHCPVCGEASVAKALTPNPYHQLFSCKLCGHVFVPIFVLEAKKNQEVQLEYFGEAFSRRQGFFINLYEHINARRMVRALGRKQQQRILEIGPGSGTVMAWLAKNGHDICGLDMSHAVAKQIKQRWGLPVTAEPLETYVKTIGKGIFDTIIMRHVLEHFTDPYEALRNTHALLKPGGKLHIAVPNMASWHRHFRGWSGYEPYHVHYFNQKSLSIALCHAGFRVTNIASYESLSGWPNTILHSLLSGKKNEGQIELSNASWKRQVLETIRLVTGCLISPIRWFQSFLGKGEELTLVAEKVSR